jgi:hypothetical protein
VKPPKTVTPYSEEGQTARANGDAQRLATPSCAGLLVKWQYFANNLLK